MNRSGIYRELAVLGRWEDVNGDGYHDAAEGFFDSDPLALCGSFWQDTLDAMQLVRLLRGLSPSRVGKSQRGIAAPWGTGPSPNLWLGSRT